MGDDMHKVIAVDGYSASGKGTLCDKLAEKLGYLRIDSGKFYRAITYLVIKNNINIEDEKSIIKIANDINIEYKDNVMLVNKENLKDELKTPEVDKLVIKICEIKKVRAIVNKKIRTFRKNYDIIIDGRDATTNIFKDASLKLFLMASFQERCKRRYEEYLKLGVDISLNEVEENIRYRDESDNSRKHGKLVIDEDAILINTTDLDIEEEVDIVLDLIRSEIK